MASWHVQEAYTKSWRPIWQKNQEMASANLVATGSDKRYVRRDAKGQFNESDDQGRSLAQDVKHKARTTVKSGQGDRGDQKRK
jgi:hypothetical protein